MLNWIDYLLILTRTLTSGFLFCIISFFIFNLVRACVRMCAEGGSPSTLYLALWRRYFFPWMTLPLFHSIIVAMLTQIENRINIGLIWFSFVYASLFCFVAFFFFVSCTGKINRTAAAAAAHRISVLIKNTTKCEAISNCCDRGYWILKFQYALAANRLSVHININKSIWHYRCF